MYYYVNSIILTTLFLLSCLDDGDDGLESLGVAEDGEEVVEEDALLGEVRVRPQRKSSTLLRRITE